MPAVQKPRRQSGGRQHGVGGQPQLRHITPFEEDRERNNRVRTTKYTWYSFLFNTLAEQLSLFANAYFLIVGALQLIPEISNSDGAPLTYIPLCAVLLAGAFKDAAEDFRRRRNDRLENAQPATKVSLDSSEYMISWERIRPGMLLKVCDGERIPADGLLLATSWEGGECFVETAALDGKSGWVRKSSAYSPEQWRELLRISKDGAKVACELEVPSAALDHLGGTIEEPFEELEGSKQGVSIENMLLRGSRLQQTEWVICLAAFTGHETRVMQNFRRSPSKRSPLERRFNMFITIVVLLQLTGCCILASLGVAFDQAATAMWYLAPQPADSGGGFFDLALQWVIKAGTWFLQTAPVVPIALVLMLTIIKSTHGVIVAWDERCGKPHEGRAAKVLASRNFETLGEVTHVFADKTGTLTENDLEYRACSVGVTMYGINEGTARSHLQEPHVDFKADRFFEDLKMQPQPARRNPHTSMMLDTPSTMAGNLSVGGEQPRAIAAFVLTHALCHTVEATGNAEQDVESLESNGDTLLDRDKYCAASPDELSLVWGAHALGITFISRSQSEIQLLVTAPDMQKAVDGVVGWRRSGHATQSCIMDGLLHVELLDVCDFDSDRQRMSVVVRFPNGNLLLLMKGADSAVLPHTSRDPKAMMIIDKHLTSFAGMGLRTLCFASRILTEEQYNPWHTQYAAAQAFSGANRHRRLSKCVRDLEVGMGPLHFLGTAALDDKLQDEVPQTLQILQQAGIATWVLTGDKAETAINVAFACKLLDSSMHNFLVDDLSEDQVPWLVREVKKASRPCITISGAALPAALASPESKVLLAEALAICAAVIFCRVSPSQKAEVVQLVRATSPQATTLAIGDGANDTAMLASAHVGIGVSGKEVAPQAEGTADVAVAEFRNLGRLLFVHGRESCRRLSLVGLYSFYKSVLLVLPTVLLAQSSGASGANMFHPLVFQGVDLLCASMPLLLFGCFDRGKTDLDFLEGDPSNWGRTTYSNPLQLAWLMAACLQALSFHWLAFWLLERGRGNADSVELSDIFTMGEVQLIWVVLGTNITLAMCQNSWFCIMHLLAYAFSACALCFCIWATTMTQWPTNTTWQILLGGDLPRIIAASFVALVLHCVINQLFVTLLTSDVLAGLAECAEIEHRLHERSHKCLYSCLNRFCPCFPCFKRRSLSARRRKGGGGLDGAGRKVLELPRMISQPHRDRPHQDGAGRLPQLKLPSQSATQSPAMSSLSAARPPQGGSGQPRSGQLPMEMSASSASTFSNVSNASPTRVGAGRLPPSEINMQMSGSNLSVIWSPRGGERPLHDPSMEMMQSNLSGSLRGGGAGPLPKKDWSMVEARRRILSPSSGMKQQQACSSSSEGDKECGKKQPRRRQERQPQQGPPRNKITERRIRNGTGPARDSFDKHRPLLSDEASSQSETRRPAALEANYVNTPRSTRQRQQHLLGQRSNSLLSMESKASQRTCHTEKQEFERSTSRHRLSDLAKDDEKQFVRLSSGFTSGTDAGQGDSFKLAPTAARAVWTKYEQMDYQDAEADLHSMKCGTAAELEEAQLWAEEEAASGIGIRNGIAVIKKTRHPLSFDDLKVSRSENTVFWLFAAPALSTPKTPVTPIAQRRFTAVSMFASAPRRISDVDMVVASSEEDELLL